MSNLKEDHDAAPPAIAVVGVSALFPGSTNVRGFWRNIMEGRDEIRDIPPNYWLIDDYYDPDPTAPDKTYGKRGAFLDAVPFDALGFGVPPNAVQQTDTSQLLGLIVAQQVLEDAAVGDFQHVDKQRISVILGATGTTELVVHLGSRLQRPIWLNALRANGIAEDEAQAICDRIAASYVPWTEASFPGLLGNVIAGRIANKFDLGGTNCVVDAACASSLSALAMGLSELYLHQSDMVIVGGVDTLNDILMYMCFSKTPALSVSGDCRPFSDQADGTILGEGLGMLALRRLEDAERDGDRIYALIRGLGSSSDGKGTAIYAPKASGQAQALRRAYAVAGYSPRTVELLEAHGTATKAGDAAEFAGAATVFAEADDESLQWCAIGSVKSQIGHTKGAAGAASLIKAVLALHHKALPPTIKVERPSAALGVETSPFYINTQARPWVRDATHPRRAAVSSFGFGGSNFHVTLEEYTGEHNRKDRFRPSPTELFLISGDKAEEVVAAAQQLSQEIEDPGDLQFLARATQHAFLGTERYRLAVIASDIADLRAKLDAAAVAIQHDSSTAQRSPAGWYYSGSGEGAGSGKLAFLFPGQGSQYVGMGTDLALAFDECHSVWDEAANLEFEQGGRLHDVVFPPPVFTDADRRAREDQLRATEWAQPAIGVASLGQLLLLDRLGIVPDAVGGHSFGEVTALHAAGAFDRRGFFSVARKRGALMAEAAAMFPGAMTAISHGFEEIAALLASWETGVVLANHNGPNQVVISGIESAIAATEARLAQAGIRFQRLPVATAFHSPVVRPASAPFRSFLEHIPVHKPAMPVYANSTAAIYSSVPEVVRETLAEQIAHPVRFVEQIEAMYVAGVRTFVEVGPNMVLTNLVKSCLGNRPHDAIALDRKGQHGLTSLWHALAQLAVAGVPVQWARLWDGVACGTDPRTRKTPKLALPISGVNYAKPYPPAGGSSALAAPNGARRENATSMKENQASRHTGTNGAAVANGPAAVPPGNKPAVAVAPARMETAPPLPPTVPATATPVAAPVAAAAPAAQPTLAPAPAPTPAPIQAYVPATTPPAATPPIAVAQSNSEALAWVGAFQELQRQTVDAHMAFLQVAEQSMRSLETMLTLGHSSGNGSANTLVQTAPSPAVAYRSPAPAPAVTSDTVAGANGHAIVAPPPAPPTRAPEPLPAPLLPAARPAAVEMPPRAAAATHDLHAMMLAVVTEKTGYPTEMLEPGMALDTDLGIDSIKRVEILAAMRERVPALPEFDTTIMAGLRTLGEIVDYMDAQLAGAPAAAGASAPGVVKALPRTTAFTQNLHAVMLAVVTEKTGYPTEMLEPGMALDTDLGIDSIKRVEILAAVREQVPALPEFDTTIMAGLRTLGEIVAYMDAQLATAPAQSNVASPAAMVPASRTATAAHDLHAVMLAVVTEKTGYPTEMLEPGMALDTDLGIDSIKRVEILAAVRERVPALPEFDTTIMAGLRTLGEIIAYMDAQLGGTPAAPASRSTSSIPTPSAVAVATEDIHAVMLAVVTEKTGYPTEMLEPGMALDTDLGIDSIKRVEILAAVRERVPALPEFDTTLMAGLRTLGEIVAYMDAQLAGTPAPAAPVQVAAAATVTPVATDDAAIGRYVLQMVPRPAPGLAPPFLLDGTPVYITDDGGGVAPALAEALAATGAQAVVCTAVPAQARAVICLAGLAAMPDEDTALAANEEAFAVATTIAAGFEAEGGLFVVVQDTGGDFGLTAASGPRAWSGGLTGLAKTAAQEWPKATVRALDLGRGQQPPDVVAARLAQELCTGAADREIGLMEDGRRATPVSVEGATAGGAAVIDKSSVVVISGGGRGVTAAAAIELARAAQPRIALLGRTVLEDEPEALRAYMDDAGLKQALLAQAQAEGIRLTPKQLGAGAARIQAAREIRATLVAIEAAGSSAMYIPCDITDAEATGAALQAVREQWGPITAIVHGAGVLADKRLAEKSAADFRQVFGTKIDGLRSLLAATQPDPLTAICLFSSVAGRTGNAGQSDYAMANEVLNRVANELARQRPDCVVKSIGWGPWEGGMVTPLLKAKFDEMGVALIPLATGARRFVAELQQAARAEVEVVIGGLPQNAPLVNPRQGQTAQPALYDVVVNAASQPYLCSHQINGAVVLPLVLVQEWFLQAANAANEGPAYRGLQKLRVLKGIPLPQFEAQSTRLRIKVEPERPDRTLLKATLFDAAGVARFAAQVVQSPPPLPEAAPDANWPAANLAGADLYGARLFHGPQFAAIQAVDQLGDTGAQALLLGSQNLGWGSNGWQSDPALIDGGLQLARIWSYERLQRLTLPTAVETFAVYLPGLFNAGQLPDRQVRCIVQGKTIGQSGTRSDLWFYDAQTGELLAALRGLEMYVSTEAPLAGGAN